MRREDRPKWKVLHELLDLFHDDRLTSAQFWAQMRQHGLTDHDIDLYCEGKMERIGLASRGRCG